MRCVSSAELVCLLYWLVVVVILHVRDDPRYSRQTGWCCAESGWAELDPCEQWLRLEPVWP